MKFIITESVLEKAVSLYLDKKNFIVKNESSYHIYLFTSEKDIIKNNYDIKYGTTDGVCAISYELYKEVRDFFSLWGDEAKIVIAKWVENNFGEVTRFYIT